MQLAVARSCQPNGAYSLFTELPTYLTLAFRSSVQHESDLLEYDGSFCASRRQSPAAFSPPLKVQELNALSTIHQSAERHVI